MTKHLVLVVPGLDPVRILRVAATLGGSDLVIPVTDSANHWADTLAELLREIDRHPRVHFVEVDEWHFAEVLQALQDALLALHADGDLFDLVIGGGTKPISSAAGVVAAQWRARTWVLDEKHDRLIGDVGLVPIVEPGVNLAPDRLGRLYSVHHEIPADEPAGNEPLLRWLRSALSGGVRGADTEREQVSRTFESAVVSLLRAVVPDDFDVWGPRTFVLRDPATPQEPAVDQQDAEQVRRFEIDGVVVRGTRMWVVESKFIGSQLTQTRMRTAFAELNRRRLDMGGPTATGVLVVLNEEQASAMPEGPVDDFAPAGIEVLGANDLRAALQALDADDDQALRTTEVARVFRTRGE
jgi:hypothetical protein